MPEMYMQIRWYPYYLCHTRGCDSYGKSLPRDKVETAFEGFLRRLVPTDKLVQVATAMFRDAWSQRTEQAKQADRALVKQIAAIDKEVDALLDNIVQASAPRVIAAFEARITKLDTEKQILSKRRTQIAAPSKGLEEMLELSLKFLASPWKIWATGDLSLRRTVLKLALADRVQYYRKDGLRTPKTTLPFKALSHINDQFLKMVRMRRLELPRVLPHSDLNAARLPFRHIRTINGQRSLACQGSLVKSDFCIFPKSTRTDGIA